MAIFRKKPSQQVDPGLGDCGALDRPMLALNVIVSRRSHEQDIRPRFIYRQAPISPSDSGWSAVIGDESPEELDDPGALLSQAVGLLLDRWPDLRPVFDTEALESEWAWDEGAQRYVPHPRRS